MRHTRSTHTLTHTCARTNTHTHTCAHTHTFAHTHTHTRARCIGKYACIKPDGSQCEPGDHAYINLMDHRVRHAAAVHTHTRAHCIGNYACNKPDGSQGEPGNSTWNLMEFSVNQVIVHKPSAPLQGSRDSQHPIQHGRDSQHFTTAWMLQPTLQYSGDATASTTLQRGCYS